MCYFSYIYSSNPKTGSLDQVQCRRAFVDPSASCLSKSIDLSRTCMVSVWEYSSAGQVNGGRLFFLVHLNALL